MFKSKRREYLLALAKKLLIKEDKLNYVGEIYHDPNKEEGRAKKGKLGDYVFYESFDTQGDIITRVNSYFISDGERWIESEEEIREFYRMDFANCFLHADEYSKKDFNDEEEEEEND